VPWREEFKESFDEYSKIKSSVDQKRNLLLEEIARMRKKEQELVAQELARALMHRKGFHTAEEPTRSPLHLNVGSPNSSNHPAPTLETTTYFSQEGRAVLEQLISLSRHSGSDDADDRSGSDCGSDCSEAIDDVLPS
jgi:hypothetical protein